MAQVALLYASLTLESSSFIWNLKKSVDQTSRSAAAIERQARVEQCDLCHIGRS